MYLRFLTGFLGADSYLQVVCKLDVRNPGTACFLGKHLELQQQQHLQVNLCGTVVKAQNTIKDFKKSVEYFT